MSRLFIANPTKQNNHFFYQIPEINRLSDIVIPAGGQIELGKNLTKAQLDGIVDQHKDHGMIKVSEVQRYESQKVLLIYNFDKPIDLEMINHRINKMTMWHWPFPMKSG